MMEARRESRGGICLIVDEVELYGEEPVEAVIKDQVFYHAGDLMIPARPDSGVDMRQGPSGPRPKPNDGGKEGDANKENENQGKGDPMEGKGDKMSEFNLAALERDLLEYDFNETEDSGTIETLVLMTPSSFMSSNKEPSASLSPVESGSLVEAHQSRGAPKLLCESPRWRRIDESMRVAFLSTLPEEEWERYQ